MAAFGLTSQLDRLPSDTTAPCPAIRDSPASGAVAARVMPSTRVTGISVLRGLKASAASSAAL